MTDPAEPTATAEPTETTIKRFLCRHIHTSGSRCGSPALRGESFCYYHHTTRRPAPRHRDVLLDNRDSHDPPLRRAMRSRICRLLWTIRRA